MTHFPLADDEDPTFTLSQLKAFNECIEALSSSGISPGIVHAANTPATFRFQSSWFDMVRPVYPCPFYLLLDS